MPPYTETSQFVIAVEPDSDGKYALMLLTTRTRHDGVKTDSVTQIGQYPTQPFANHAVIVLSTFYHLRHV